MTVAKQNKSKILGIIITAIILVALFGSFIIIGKSNTIDSGISPKMITKTIIFGNIKNKENAIIQISPINRLTELKTDFGLNQINFESSSRANGVIDIKNETSNDVHLVEKTRLVNNGGVVFELIDGVTIPKATYDTAGNLIAGKKSTFIVAKVYDENAIFIGSRGNLQTGTIFSFPGLKANKDKVYAIASSKLTGGNDNIAYIKTGENTEKAKQVFLIKLKEKSLYELKDVVKNLSTQNKNFKLLDYKDIFSFSNININQTPISQTDKQISLSGNIKIKGYFFDFQNLTDILKLDIQKTLNKQNNIIFDEASFKLSNIKIINKNPLKIEANISINYSIK